MSQNPFSDSFPEPPSASEPRRQVAQPEMPESRPRRPGCGRSCLLTVLVVLLLISLSANLGWLFGTGMETPTKLREKYVALNRFGENKVAIISLEGMIIEGRNSFTKRQIDQAMKDDRVKAVVLRVNSPGGTVTGADYLYHYLKELSAKKPLVVSMGSIAASGGYYVSMAVGDRPDTIFAEPTTWTGSIGVIIPHYNLAGLFGQLGVEEDSIASHRLKNMGSLARKMTEEEKEIFQQLVDESFARFKHIIRQGRPKFRDQPEALDPLATGQVFTAEQALKAGLVDKIGFLEEAIDRAIELAGISREETCVLEYKREPSLSALLFGGQIRTPRWDVTKLLDPSTPQAYYLFTRFAPLIRSDP